MNHAEKSRLVYRILSGIVYFTYRDKRYELRSPTVETLYQASELYADIYYQESFNGNRFDIEFLSGIPNFDAKIKQMSDRQDDIKVEMYENHINPDMLKKLRLQLDAVKNGISKAYGERQKFEHLTPEGLAGIAQSQFLIADCIYDTYGNRVFGSSTDDIFYSLLESMMTEVYNLEIGELEIREIARSDLWRSYWNVDKHNVFGRSPRDLNNDQRRLVGYSRMYDSIYDNPECPIDIVLEDDDLLDGWMIKMRRDREKDKNTKELDKVLTKHKTDSEIFLMAKTDEDAQTIDNLNTPMAKIQKKQRGSIIKSRPDGVTDLQFPDVQIDLLNQSQQRKMP